MIAFYNLAEDDVQAAITNARGKVERYVRTFRHGKSLDTRDKTVITVDDGAATGETLKAAIHWLRGEPHRAQNVMIAVPVGSPDTMAELEAMADKTVCLYAPEDFMAVGQYYRHFTPVSDDEVLDILYGSGNLTAFDTP